ncbi:stage III sporulation protein AF [Lachnospiraceae bacterium 62-35]
MEALYIWVKNIAAYLVFLTILTSLLPSGKYEKYVRLFAGMILILIVTAPFLSGIRLEDKIAGCFEEFSFKNEAEDFKREIYGMEEKRLSRLIEQYEEAVAMDVGQMAIEAGIDLLDVEVRIEGGQESESFGKVKAIRITASGRQAEEREKAASLRRKASQYYQLEERHVEIQFQNDKG